MGKKNNKKRQVLARSAEKRFIRQMRGKLRKRLANKGRVSREQRKRYGLKVGAYYNEKILARKGQLKLIEIKIPKVFCFFRDPKGTSDFFADLEKVLNKQSPKNVFISHADTEHIGLAASFIFDQMIKEERDHWLTYGIKINFSGKITSSKKVNNFLLSYGLLKLLDIQPDKFSPNIVDFDYAKKYVTLKIEGSKQRSYEAGLVSQALVKYFNDCFNHNGFEIANDTQLNLIGSFGEIIGNAEEHSGAVNSVWYALGCYDKDSHSCSFAIINYGKTIYESLSDEDSTAAEVIGQVQEVIKSHRPVLEKLYGLVAKHHEEPSWNVMALQDGISSKRTQSGQGSTRGQGLMDVLSFIDEVKAKQGDAEISLISGHSAINIDFDYPILKKEIGPNKEKRRLMFFNKNQSFQHPPDGKKVVFLKNKFQGTIFTGTFRIDKTYLREKIKNEKDRNQPK